jgi:hypothetical protein
MKGDSLFATPPFSFFLYNKINKNDFQSNSKVLDTFALLDDYDILASVKTWTEHPDIILSTLCKKMINRDLFKIVFSKTPPSPEHIIKMQAEAARMYNIPSEDADYFVFSDKVENSTYSSDSVNINILMKDGQIMDIAEVSDQYDLKTLTQKVTKYFLCYPKELVLKAEVE